MEELYAGLIGTPYEEKDCWQIARDFYTRVFGYELEEYYKEVPSTKEDANKMILYAMEDFEEVSTPQFGDLVLIKIYGVESHIAVFVGRDSILHTRKGVGCVIETLEKWKKLVVGFYRVKI